MLRRRSTHLHTHLFSSHLSCSFVFCLTLSFSARLGPSITLFCILAQTPSFTMASFSKPQNVMTMVFAFLALLHFTAALHHGAHHHNHPRSLSHDNVIQAQMDVVSEELSKRQSEGFLAITGVANQGSAPRLEIRTLRQNADQWNLYILGMERFMAKAKTDRLSYYQVAGMCASEQMVRGRLVLNIPYRYSRSSLCLVGRFPHPPRQPGWFLPSCSESLWLVAQALPCSFRASLVPVRFGGCCYLPCQLAPALDECCIRPPHALLGLGHGSGHQPAYCPPDDARPDHQRHQASGPGHHCQPAVRVQLWQLTSL